MKLDLYSHQKEAIGKLRSGSILCGGVGSGKSRTALAYFWKIETDRMRRPKPLIVITTARKRDSLDWEREGLYFGLSHDSTSSVRFVVDSWNNIKKYEGEEESFFIFDEQRVVGSGAWVKSFLKIVKRNRWILLSATPGDRWEDYVPVFVANGFYRNRTEFYKRHVVFSRFSKYPKVERYLDEQRLEKCKNYILVQMPDSRPTRRHPILVECGFDSHRFMRVFRGRWNVFLHRPVLQAGEWCYTLRRVVNGDPDRGNHLRLIFEERRKLVVFYNFDYELDILEPLCTEWCNSCSGVCACYNGHRHEDLPEGSCWIYLVQYNAASEAWNCTTTDTVVFYSLNYSYRMMEQASGRIDRMDTPYVDLYYYILYSKSTIDKSILNALKNKRKFNENKFYTKFTKKE